MGKPIKRVKESITSVEYKKLMVFVRGDDSIKENTRNNLLRTFCILYYTGLRLNELQVMRIKNIKELIKHGDTVIYTSKTNSERKIYSSDKFKKELVRIFDLSIEDEDNRVICKFGRRYKKTGITHSTFINSVNSYIKLVLGEKFTSHCFRRGIITEMGSKGINTKIISKYIGHSDVQTTMRYITPTDSDIKKSLIR